jgi:hypothetical protein
MKSIIIYHEEICVNHTGFNLHWMFDMFSFVLGEWGEDSAEGYGSD